MLKLSVLSVLFHALVKYARPMLLELHPDWVESFDFATDMIGSILFPVAPVGEPLAAPTTGSYRDLVGYYAQRTPHNYHQYLLALAQMMLGKDDATQKEIIAALKDAINLQSAKNHGVEVDWRGKIRPGDKS